MRNKEQMYHFGACAVELTDKIIVCREKRENREFITNNKTGKMIIKVYVDNPKDNNIKCKGLNFNGNKCDFLVIEKQKNNANFIELKGHQISKAIEQLSNSVKVISNPTNQYINKKFNFINSFIVTSKVPKHINIIKDKKRFEKMNNSKLTVKNNKLEIDI